MLFPGLQTRDINFLKQVLARINDITCTDNSGFNLLHLAVTMDYFDGVKFLIEKGISINQRAAITLRTPLLCLNLSQTDDTLRILNALAEAGANSVAKDYENNSLAHVFAKNSSNCFEAMSKLAEKGANFMTTNNTGNLPHRFAAESGNISAVKALRKSPEGFDLLPRNGDGREAIEDAARGGHLNIALEYIE